MKTLSEIINKIKIISVTGDDKKMIESLTIDSRTAAENSVYFAVKGTNTDGHDYIESAINSGATAVVCENIPAIINDNCTYVVVEDVAKTVGKIASAFYDEPSEKLQLIGITGTNGKTSTATMLYDLFVSLGHDCGLVSTIEYRIKGNIFKSTHTTPDAIRLNAMMKEMVDAGCGYCFMEVSSHAIVQDRIGGLTFKGGVFTNITHDHLDYHGTFDNYIKAKKLFFDNLGRDAFALTNRDDKNGMVMLQNTKASKYSYSLRTMADFRLKVLESDFNGMLLKIDEDEAWFNMVGNFNAYNILAVYSTAFILDVPRMDIITKMTLLGRVNGRFEVYRSAGKITGIV
ncbi:MAG: UDP-N-acetylmuramoyl-L-alanyl-D-glutamate--2,6-diaminopimelate ligase, partial [Bacteroidia bacterium]|nr:UDP-N-acetylmuramoyl-L-alanyl-D-glutamate--2,6-diaminopimelate ligase [Bacteroidia bacterium]